MVGAEVSEEAVVFQPCDGKRNLTHTNYFLFSLRGRSLAKWEDRRELRMLLKEIRRKSAKSRRLVLRREIKSMGSVLRKLGLVESDSATPVVAKSSKKKKKKKTLDVEEDQNSGIGPNAIVTLKGMTAVELNQEGSELVACEMLLSGGFLAMPVEVIVSVMSCFTFDESMPSDSGGDAASSAGLPPFLTEAYRLLTDCARIVAKASISCGVYSLTPGASSAENSAMGEDDDGTEGAGVTEDGESALLLYFSNIYFSKRT